MKRKWSQEQETYLQDNWGTMTIPKIAENIGRSEGAIRGRVQKLRLGRHIHSGQMITANQLYQTITGRNINSKTLDILKKHGFPCKKKKTRTREYNMIAIDKFWKWLEKTPNALSIANMQEGALGKEPEWLKERRHIDAEKKKINKKGSRKWTELEDQRLIVYVNQQRYTYPEIAKMLNRSESAVGARLQLLKVPGRPIRKDSKKWTEEEIQTAKKMKSKGHSEETIAKEIGRTAMSVRGLLYREEKERNDQ